jgi:hypothetical protein
MGIAEALGNLNPPPARRPNAQTPKRLSVAPSKRLSGETPERPGLALQGTAKSKHPDFVKKTLYVRERTMRDAFRRYQDAGGKDESDLVEMLLGKYLAGVIHA